jgi:hypothetical protein
MYEFAKHGDWALLRKQLMYSNFRRSFAMSLQYSVAELRGEA